MKYEWVDIKHFISRTKFIYREYRPSPSDIADFSLFMHHVLFEMTTARLTRLKTDVPWRRNEKIRGQKISTDSEVEGQRVISTCQRYIDVRNVNMKGDALNLVSCWHIEATLSNIVIPVCYQSDSIKSSHFQYHTDKCQFDQIKRTGYWYVTPNQWGLERKSWGDNVFCRAKWLYVLIIVLRIFNAPLTERD